MSKNDDDKAKVVIRYTEKDIGRFWRSLEGYDERDYTLLKKSITAEYPGAERGKRYTQRQLEKLTEKAVRKRIHGERDLTGYYSKFRPIAVPRESEEEDCMENGYRGSESPKR